MQALALLFILLPQASCGFFAVTFAPDKEAKSSEPGALDYAYAKFWEVFHGGHYDRINEAMIPLKAAYLKNPHDPTLAARIGFLHVWSLSERHRLNDIPPMVTDHATLARKYFEEANKLAPDDARYKGFHSVLLMTEGTIHNDVAMIRKGYFQGLESIRDWPQFNNFTVGYVLSRHPARSERFAEGLEMQWRTLDECLDRSIPRDSLELGSLEGIEDAEHRPEYKRACWNSKSAPYNFQGFFLNFGDMLLKAGESQLARAAYLVAKEHRDFGTWPYQDELLKRLSPQSGHEGDEPLMIDTSYACMACHQAH